MSAQIEAPGATGELGRIRIGIGITTFNRAAMLERTIEAVRRHTVLPHLLFVADDGSADDTAVLLERLGVCSVSPPNRGIAWNKNRALFFLFGVARCDVAILLEDDTFPDRDGWEADWARAALRHGHMNLAPSHWPRNYLSGSGSVTDPFVSKNLTGQCAAFGAAAIRDVGYMDTRFRRYGYEHVDHTLRLNKAGYGGVLRVEAADILPLLMSSDLVVTGLDKLPEYDGIALNGPVFGQSLAEPLFRHAWRSDEEQAFLRWEMGLVRRAEGATPWEPVAETRPAYADWAIRFADGTEAGLVAGDVAEMLRLRTGPDGARLLREDADGTMHPVAFDADGRMSAPGANGGSELLALDYPPGPGFVLRGASGFLRRNSGAQGGLVCGGGDAEIFRFERFMLPRWRPRRANFGAPRRAGH